MLHDLLVDMKLDQLPNYQYLPASKIESACAEIDVAQLQDILKKYTAAEDMFTQPYLHGTTQNIKLLVDMGKSVDQSRDEADVMYGTITTRETLYVRCLVEVFRAWYHKTQPLTEVKVESQARSEVQVVKTDEFGLDVNGVKLLD